MAVTTNYVWSNVKDFSFGVDMTRVTGLGAGGFVAYTGDLNSADTARVYDRDGKYLANWSSEFSSFNYSGGVQLKNGSVVNYGFGPDGNTFEIHNANGALVKAPTASAGFADLAALANGGFVGVSEKALEITLDIYSATGALANTVHVNTGVSYQNDANVATLSNGNIAVAWSVYGAINGSTSEIWYAIYTPQGAVVCAPTMWVTSGDIAARPDVTPLNDGGFGIAFQYNGDSGDFDIALGTVTSTGAQGNGFVLTPNDAGRVQLGAQVAVLENGLLAVTYQEVIDPDNSNLILMLVDPSNGAVLDSYEVDGGANLQEVFYGYVESLGGGRIVASGRNPGFAEIVDAVRISAGDGANDTIMGDGFVDIMDAGEGADKLYGKAGDDLLYGAGGADVIDGGTGADDLRGGTGADKFYVDNIGDTILEDANADIDTVISSVNHTLAVNVENISLGGAANIGANGNASNNKMIGNDGANTMKGLEGADSLNGGAGNDVLYGGTGIDALAGGAGADTFVFNAPASANNRDTIVDFNVAADTIRLEDSVFTTIGPVGTLAANAFQIGGAAVNANVRIIYNADSGKLFYDDDGSGAHAAIWIATLDPGLALTRADFVIV